MAITISVHDGSIPLLDEIAKVHWGAAKESLSVAGNHLRVSARRAFLASQGTGWGFSIVNGRRTLTHKNRYGNPLGARFNRRTKSPDSPSNMSSFITSYLMEASMKVVVGGKNPSARVKVYRDGIPVSTMRVQGVSKSSFEIIQRLNEGGTKTLTKKQQNLLKNTEIQVLKNGKMTTIRPMQDLNLSTVKYKKRNFMAKGFVQAKSQIDRSLTKRYENIVKKNVANITVKAVKIA